MPYLLVESSLAVKVTYAIINYIILRTQLVKYPAIVTSS